MKALLQKFSHAFTGLWHASTKDTGFKLQLVISTVGISVITFVLYPLQPFEILFLVGAWVFVLVTELQNSALESALDIINPERHKNIKNSKDMAAASVLLSCGYAVLVIAVLLGARMLA